MKKTIIEREAILISQFLRVRIKESGLTEGFRKKSFSDSSFDFYLFLSELLTFPEMIRIKVYDSQGVIIWSDNKGLIGGKFRDNVDLEAALRGEVAASLEAPHKSEHVYERKYDQIMEVYTPIFGSDPTEILGVIETYKHPEGLLARIDKTRQLTWIMALLGGSSLYLGLFGIVYSGHKKQISLEEDIQKSHQRYMDLIENSPEMIHQIDAERTFLHVNKTETERLGFTLEEMKRMRLEDLAPLERREELIAHFNRILTERKSTLETTFQTNDGEDIDVEINETGFFDQTTNKLIQTRAFIRDISRRKEAEREVRFLNEYYYTILSSMNSYVRVVNSSRVIEFENHPLDIEFGQNVDNKCIPFRRWENSRISSLSEVTLSTGMTQAGEQKTPDDCFYSITSIPLKSRDGSISAIEIISDITDRKKLEQELIQQAKMAGMGLLATGLAHEIGNPIGIVEGAVQFCLQKLNPEGSLKEYLEVIQRNISAADRTIK
jgi:PAS domain S-box-containing protein